MKKKIRSIVSALLAFLVLAAMFSVPASAETPAEKYKRLKEELAAINAQISDFKKDKANAVALRQTLQDQKRVLDDMIITKQQEIADNEAALAVKEEEIALKRQNIFDSDQLLQERLVAIYRMNNSSLTSTLLNVDDFSTFLTLSDGIQRMSKTDVELLERMTREREELETQQAEINALLEQLAADKAQLEEDVAAMEANIAELNSKISSYDAALIEKQKEQKATKEEQDKAYSDWQASINKRPGSSTSGDGSKFVGGKLQWPVASGSAYISNYFGNGHRGIDISTRGATGVSAVAAADGTIIMAGWHDHPYSYGNYVVIDHGGGVRTLYAHLNQIYVSSGRISKGEAIGEVGNTGYSFGIHLHFEVQQDGGATDPLGWLQG